MIQINIMRCVSCEDKFYELDGFELDECPYCGIELRFCEPTKESFDQWEVVVNPKTGDVDIV